MTNARSRFIATPATRMISLTGSAGPDERAWVVRVAVLALEPDEAADRQPVEGVEGLALASARTFARGGKPIPNSWTRTPARRAVMKWPSSWIDHEHAEHEDEDDDRDQRSGEIESERVSDQATAPVAKAARTSASRATRVVDVGGLVRLPRRSARRPPRAGAGCPGSRALPARKRATATSSAAISAAVAREPEPAGLAGDPEGREADLVGRREVEAADGEQVRRRRRRRRVESG